MDWMMVLAALINGVGVALAVQALKVYVMPFLSLKVPWLLPVIAMGAAPLIAYATEYLFLLTGYPIDLSGILAVLTGTLAVAGYAVARQAGLESGKDRLRARARKR